MQNRPVISQIITMGDSLSDRGMMNKKKLFGFIPMSFVSGLSGVSPDGRFTNGLAWDDHLAATMASKFTIDEIRHLSHYDATDIVDAIIAKDKRFTSQIQHNYNLDDEDEVRFRNRHFIRTYNEGGLTSYNYAWKPSVSIKRFFSRLILSNLKDMQKLLIKNNNEFKIPESERAKSLIIEWSGANDLITVNAKPSKKEVDLAIKERIKNARELYQYGYRHFILFNMPDLSLTPRYQAKSLAEQQDASKWCDYFNRKLQVACNRLKLDFPDASIRVFDINEQFRDMFQHPHKYRLDPAKIRTPYTTSPDFVLNKDGTSPANGYMFWDDVHPTADVHWLLADRFYTTYQFLYDFHSPVGDSDMTLCCQFRKKHAECVAHDQNRLFGSMSHTKMHLDLTKQNALVDILRHALYEGGTRSRQVMQELGWLNSRGEINTTIPALKHAFAKLQAEGKNKPILVRTRSM